MNHEQAHRLIDRYFEGQTTLEEEAALRRYFLTGKVSDDLRAYTPLFSYWEQERKVVAPRKRSVRRRLPKMILAVAAALLLLLVARFVHEDRQPTISNFPVAERQPVDWSRYEITDEKEAMRFVKSVLKSTSERMGQGPAITVRELREVKDILD